MSGNEPRPVRRRSPPMSLSELSLLMAEVNRHDTLDRIAEGWFPDDGPPDFVFGMNSAFYFGAHGDPGVKAAMVRLAARYQERAQPRPNFFAQENRTARIAQASDIERILTTRNREDSTLGDLKGEHADRDRSLSFYVKRVATRRRAHLPTSSFFSCRVDGARDTSPGSLQRHDNYQGVHCDPEPFIEEFKSTCASLKCFYAVSGFSLLSTSYNSYRSVRTYPIFRRFPGLLYWNNWMAAPHDDRSDDWTLDANWLTAISNEMLDRLGGYEKTRAALVPSVILHPIEGGIVFQAGPRPRLGDADRGDVPEAYRRVARFLLPLRHPDWQRMDHVQGPEPLDRQRTTADWISRFD